MLNQDKITEIAREVATANLSSAVVRDVITEPMVDWYGNDALRVLIVIAPGTEEHLPGEAVLQTLAQIHDRLQAAGEDRFPFTEYATTEELESVGDPQS